MITHSFSWQQFHTVPIVGILRNMPARFLEKLATHYERAGLTNLEITMNAPDAAASIEALTKEFGGRLNIGAGTVCNLQDLDKALAAGAQFIVTPILQESVITACVAAKIPVFPGAYTPTEIYQAWSLGASMVKVFPASQLGTEYIKEVLAPLNQVKLMPTGGVHLENFADFFKAGAKAVGMGSHLFPKSIIENELWEDLEQLFLRFVSRYQDTLKHH